MEVKQTVSVRESMDKRDRERAGTLLPNSLNQSIARDHAKLRHLSLLVVSCWAHFGTITLQLTSRRPRADETFLAAVWQTTGAHAASFCCTLLNVGHIILCTHTRSQWRIGDGWLVRKNGLRFRWIILFTTKRGSFGDALLTFFTVDYLSGDRAIKNKTRRLPKVGGKFILWMTEELDWDMWTIKGHKSEFVE